MRGTKARAIRREQQRMPPDLRAEMKARIAVLAAARADITGEARKVMRDEIRAAQRTYEQLTIAARRDFERKKAEIVAQFEQRAQATTQRRAAR